MTGPEREHLAIPTPEELELAFSSMRGRVTRAVHRGESGDTAFRPNAHRILAENPHLAEHMTTLSLCIGPMVNERHMMPGDVYMLAVRDLFEILAVTTNITNLPTDPTIT